MKLYPLSLFSKYNRITYCCLRNADVVQHSEKCAWLICHILHPEHFQLEVTEVCWKIDLADLIMFLADFCSNASCVKRHFRRKFNIQTRWNFVKQNDFFMIKNVKEKMEHQILVSFKHNPVCMMAVKCNVQIFKKNPQTF